MRSEAELPPRAPLAARISDAVRLIESVGIAMPDSAPVHDYLDQHADLLDVTIRVANLLSGTFQPDAKITLALHSSHEEDDSYLVFNVRQDKYNTDLTGRIEQTWASYAADLEGKSGWLLVTTDFLKPGN